MTNIELIYMLTAFSLSIDEHNKLRRLIKENNLGYLLHSNKQSFKPMMDELFNGCYEICKGEQKNEKCE